MILRREEILKNRKREPSVDHAIDYFDSMATYIDELRKLQRELRRMIRYDPEVMWLAIRVQTWDYIYVAVNYSKGFGRYIAFTRWEAENKVHIPKVLSPRNHL